MPETIADLGSGIPVELGKIDRELKKLWEQDSGAATRASLVNFAIYCKGRDRMEENTRLIAEFTRDHACRAILIAVEPDAPQPKVQAWIGAHCHISRAGAKQVCCEQISFLLEGDTRGMIPNIVFSHLDSDLPLYLWWRGDFSRDIDAQLWTWVDRLIFDSQKWSDPGMRFQRLRESLAEIKPRLILCDLNWTRLLHLRWAFAQLFDPPGNLARLPTLHRVTITHAPRCRTTAILLLGWIMSQLRWTLAAPTAAGFELHREDGAAVAVEFSEAPGSAIGKCVFAAEDARFQIEHCPDSRFFETIAELPDGRRSESLVPAGRDEILDLLNEELMRGGKHPIYLRALNAAETLLNASR